MRNFAQLAQSRRNSLLRTSLTYVFNYGPCPSIENYIKNVYEIREKRKIKRKREKKKEKHSHLDKTDVVTVSPVIFK